MSPQPPCQNLTFLPAEVFAKEAAWRPGPWHAVNAHLWHRAGQRLSFFTLWDEVRR